jgi:hypothetical protein
MTAAESIASLLPSSFLFLVFTSFFNISTASCEASHWCGETLFGLV